MKGRIIDIRAGIPLLSAALIFTAGCGGGDGGGSRRVEPASLTIVYSSDLQGKVRSCGCTHEDVGGLGRRATFTREVRETAKNLLVLDVGDAFGLDLSFTKDEAELTFECFELIGLDAFTPGEADFIYGLPFLVSLAENASFDFVAANILDAGTKEPVFGPHYVVRELKGGIRVAITGVLDDSVRFPGYIDRSSFEVAPVEKTLRGMLPKMREDADFLILLSHMGIERTKTLLGSVTDFDIAVIGHDNPIVKEEDKVGKTLILGTGGKGQYIGRITLNLSPEGGYTRGSMRLIPLSSNDFEIDAGVKDLFNIYEVPLTDKELKKKTEGGIK